MNSCLYECSVMHERLEPKKNKFVYNIYMYFMDLDELNILSKKLLFFSVNRFNWFSLNNTDHIHSTDKKKQNIKTNILEFLETKNIRLGGGKIFLLANLRTLGYSFNPVSFFYCYDQNGKAVCTVVEVCNTFKERKLYLLNEETYRNGRFEKMTTKYFYVSPFSPLDTSFDFNIGIPDEKLAIRIDDYQDGRRVLLSAVSGVKKKLNNLSLIYYGLKFPLVTLKIIFLIHWQAMIIYFKKVPFIRKGENMHQQQEIYKL